MEPHKTVRIIDPSEYVDRLSEFPKELDYIKVYLANTRTGHAYPDKNCVTIPSWVFSKPSGYFIFYIAHELSHILAHIEFGDGHYHNSKYYSCFKRLCPQEFYHFEADYKPRNAIAAGVSYRTG